MNLFDVLQPVAADAGRIIPMLRWEGGEFHPAIRRQRLEYDSVPQSSFRTISEAHVSERRATCERYLSSLDRIGRARRGVRFHTTMRPEANTW